MRDFMDTTQSAQDIVIRQLMSAAEQARENAYAPYSKFPVGAALLTADGNVYSGCNVENIAYGSTMCAERSAVFSAVSDGKTKFLAIAVLADLPTPVRPCGACLQVLGEFFGKDTKVFLATTRDPDNVLSLDFQDLLPYNPKESVRHS